MKVTYHPEGADTPKVWEFSPGKLRESRAEMIEKRYATLRGDKDAGSMEIVIASAMQGQSSARRAILWHLLNLDHGVLDIKDVDPIRDELVIEPNHDELLKIRVAVAAMAGLTDNERDMALAQIDAEIARLAYAGDAGEGKALSLSSESATG